MRPVYYIVGAAASSPPIPPDIYLNPFSVSLRAVILDTGADATYTVEWTQDDIWAVGYDPDAATSVWEPVAGMSAAVVDAYATFNSPVRAFRIRQTAGADRVQLAVVQGGAA
jgi:hypothetical protein